MNTVVIRISPTASVRMACDLMHREGVGIVCICDEHHRPLGVLTDRDVVVRACARRRSPETTLVQDVMTRAPLVCGMETDLSEVAGLMKSARLGRILVVDDQGRLVGIITLAEIWHYENPLAAASVSRTASERQFSAQLSRLPVGARTPCTSLLSGPSQGRR